MLLLVVSEGQVSRRLERIGIREVQCFVLELRLH